MEAARAEEDKRMVGGKRSTSPAVDRKQRRSSGNGSANVSTIFLLMHKSVYGNETDYCINDSDVRLLRSVFLHLHVVTKTNMSTSILSRLPHQLIRSPTQLFVPTFVDKLNTGEALPPSNHHHRPRIHYNRIQHQCYYLVNNTFNQT
jgi:hypothetical protein